MNTVLRLLCTSLALLVPTLGYGHSLNDSYLDLALQDGKWQGSLQLAIADLEISVGVDSNDNGEVSWAEMQSAANRINSYAQSRLNLSRGNQPCTTTAGEHRLSQKAGTVFLHIPLAGYCGSESGPVSLGYTAMFDVDRSHRGIATLNLDGEVFNQVFAPDRTRVELQPGQSSWLSTLGQFIEEGIWHIWIGIDHVLFILAMLLGVVLHGLPGKEHRAGVLPVSAEILKLVTAFTIAHSITLVLATLKLVALPAYLVEAAIAVTVILGGINIIWPLFGQRQWLFAGGFGLIHGFGFANVLAGLSLSQGQFLLSLLGFNIGVELGQLFIVAMVTPLLVLLRYQSWCRSWGRTLSGLLITQAGVLWFLQRI